jgi:primosomal protein N''
LAIALEGAGDILKQLQPAAGKDRTAIAILADRLSANSRFLRASMGVHVRAPLS